MSDREFGYGLGGTFLGIAIASWFFLMLDHWQERLVERVWGSKRWTH